MSKSTVGFKIDIIVEPDEEGFYAYCPALKGLHVGGRTEEEALNNARDAAIAYLESLMKHNESIPVGIVMLEESSSPHTVQRRNVRRHTEDLQVACAT